MDARPNASRTMYIFYVRVRGAVHEPELYRERANKGIWYKLILGSVASHKTEPGASYNT